MSVTVADVIVPLKNYARNQNLTDARSISAINSAVRYVKTQAQLPGYEREYEFDYSDDLHIYLLPTGVDELNWLRYDDDDKNKRGRFSRRPSEYLFERFSTQGGETRLFGWYNGNNLNNLVVVALNTVSSLPIDSFDYDNATNWIATNDATNVRDDLITYKEGAGSLAFDVDVSSSVTNRATLTKTVSAYDLQPYIDKGHFRAWAYIPDVTNFTSISFSWGTDGSNYYKQTVTTAYDGSAFADGWQKLDLPWVGSTAVGSPDATNITKFWFDFDYAVGYTDEVDFRLDDLRLVTPDKMILNYTSRYVGKATGVGADLDAFTATTDEFYFGSYDPSLIEYVAVMAAVILNPQLLVDDKSVRDIYNAYNKSFKAKYPKKRTNNLLVDPKVSSTSLNF